MSIIIYLIAASIVLLIAFVIFRQVQRDYLQFSKLTPFSAFLQVLVFALHALLLNLGFIDTDWPRLHIRGLSLVLGVFSAVLGISLLLAAIGVFGFRRMVGREVNVLRQSGVYRWTRNPQLVGYGLIVLTFPLLWPSWYMVISFIVYVAIAHFMVLTEEEHLRRVYGEEYDRYCERTPRYIGLPKPRPREGN